GGRLGWGRTDISSHELAYYFPSPFSRAGNGTLHTSMCPAGTLYHSSLRFRRDSISAVNVAVSVRSTSMALRSDAGRSAATCTVLIGTYCSGLSYMPIGAGPRGSAESS